MSQHTQPKGQATPETSLYWKYTYLFKFVRFVEVRDLPAGEDVVDVLQEGLLHYLCVVEQEHHWLVLSSRLVVQVTNVWGEGREGGREGGRWMDGEGGG